MKIDVEFYVQRLKEHEAQRLSTTERQQFWETYSKQQRKLDEETSFDMSRYS